MKNVNKAVVVESGWVLLKNFILKRGRWSNKFLSLPILKMPNNLSMLETKSLNNKGRSDFFVTALWYCTMTMFLIPHFLYYNNKHVYSMILICFLGRYSVYISNLLVLFQVGHSISFTPSLLWYYYFTLPLLFKIFQYFLFYMLLLCYVTTLVSPLI